MIAPGPGGNPLTDQLRVFEAEPLGFLRDMHRSYGDVVRLRWWPELYHLISDPDDVRHVLVDAADNYHPAVEPSVTPDGSAHPAHRFHQVVRDVLHTDGGVAAMVPAVTGVVAEWLERWDAPARRGEPLDLATEMAGLTVAVIGSAFLAADLGDEAKALADALSVAAKAGALQRRVSVLQSMATPSPAPDRALGDAAEAVEMVVRRLITDRRQAGPAGPDLLSRLVFDRDTNDPDRLVSDDQVVAALWVLLIAGHSAPSSALAWALHVVGSQPEVRARLEAEVDAVLGDRAPTAVDLARLRYTRLVVLETMRLYPPVWMLQPRSVLAADHIGGYQIPAGTKVAISPWVLHHHPGHWSRPDVFDPERFARNEPRAYLPFGAGPGGCVAAQLGLTEARVALAMIVQRYSWEPTSTATVVPEPLVSLWPRGGAPVVLRRRAGVTASHTE